MCRPHKHEKTTRRVSYTPSSSATEHDFTLEHSDSYLQHRDSLKLSDMSSNYRISSSHAARSYNNNMHNFSARNQKSNVVVMEFHRIVVRPVVCCIPEDHPLKISWDFITILLSVVVGVYMNHISIQNNCFAHYLYDYCSAAVTHVSGDNKFSFREMSAFLQLWHAMDIMLGFFTTKRNNQGDMTQKSRSNDPSDVDNTNKRKKDLVSLLWVLLDVAGVLVPWERIFVQPALEIYKREGVCTKLFRLFKFVKKRNVEQIRKGIHKLVQFFRFIGWRTTRNIIPFIPKYIIFLKEMNVVILIRIVRCMYRMERLYSLTL